MIDQTAYRSSHPEVLIAWHQYIGLRDAFHRHMDALRAEYPKHRAEGVTVGGDRLLFRCLSENPEKPAEPPPGPWRSEWVKPLYAIGWVPDRRTKAGKDLDQHVRAADVRHELALPGLPTQVETDRRGTTPGSTVWAVPGLHFTESIDAAPVIYALYDATHEQVAKGGWSRETLDETMWERIKMSEYYAAIEAEEVSA